MVKEISALLQLLAHRVATPSIRHLLIFAGVKETSNLNCKLIGRAILFKELEEVLDFIGL
jgi:hypothetical protein